MLDDSTNCFIPKHLIYSRPAPGIGRQRVCKFAMAGLHFGFLPSQPDKALSHFLPSRPPLTMSMSIHVLALTSHSQLKTLPDMSDALLQSPSRFLHPPGAFSKAHYSLTWSICLQFSDSSRLVLTPERHEKSLSQFHDC
jgi:hypothetical protein